MKDMSKWVWVGVVVLIILACVFLRGHTKRTVEASDGSLPDNTIVDPDVDPKFDRGVLVDGRFWTQTDVEKEGGFFRCPVKVQKALRLLFLNDLIALQALVKRRFAAWQARTPDARWRPRYAKFTEALEVVHGAIKRLDSPQCDPTELQPVFSRVSVLLRGF
jgi:hypothetical protein